MSHEYPTTLSQPEVSSPSQQEVTVTERVSTGLFTLPSPSPAHQTVASTAVYAGTAFSVGAFPAYIASVQTGPRAPQSVPQSRQLALRHKVRLGVALLLMAFSLTNILLRLSGLPSFSDFFSNLVLFIVSMGLVGTAVYLAEESTPS